MAYAGFERKFFIFSGSENLASLLWVLGENIVVVLLAIIIITACIYFSRKYKWFRYFMVALIAVTVLEFVARYYQYNYLCDYFIFKERDRVNRVYGCDGGACVGDDQFPLITFTKTYDHKDRYIFDYRLFKRISFSEKDGLYVGSYIQLSMSLFPFWLEKFLFTIDLRGSSVCKNYE